MIYNLSCFSNYNGSADVLVVKKKKIWINLFLVCPRRFGPTEICLLYNQFFCCLCPFLGSGNNRLIKMVWMLQHTVSLLLAVHVIYSTLVSFSSNISFLSATKGDIVVFLISYTIFHQLQIYHHYSVYSLSVTRIDRRYTMWMSILSAPFILILPHFYLSVKVHDWPRKS